MGDNIRLQRLPPFAHLPCQQNVHGNLKGPTPPTPRFLQEIAGLLFLKKAGYKLGGFRYLLFSFLGKWLNLTTLRIIGPSKLAILRTLTLLYRFQPFHSRVQDPWGKLPFAAEVYGTSSFSHGTLPVMRQVLPADLMDPTWTLPESNEGP